MQSITARVTPYDDDSGWKSTDITTGKTVTPGTHEAERVAGGIAPEFGDAGGAAGSPSEKYQRIPFLTNLFPRSILGLVVIGFLLVALPLIISVVRGVIYLDELVLRSEQLVVQGMQVTRTSELLVEHVTDMERNARQYQILGEPALLKLYQEKHDLFRARVDLLEKLAPQGATAQQFDTMRTNGESVLEILRAQPIQNDNLAAPPESDKLDKVIEHFTVLNNISIYLANESNRLIREQLQALFETARDARLSLYWQAGALIPVALLLALLFAVLITRPIRQLSHAIRSLGVGRFSREIAVSGPPELRDLADQLDWLRQRLLESEQEKNQFLRHMSHELKTPLASVREGAELLSDGTVGSLSSSQQEVASIVRENSLELQLLIENLLNFSAWREKRSKPALELLRLDSMFNELAEKYRLAVSAKGLKFDVPRTNIRLQADTSLIMTALDNLISNAVKFTPAGGIICIKLDSRDDVVQIDVIDSGPGISTKDRERLFEPFYKGRPPRGARVRGTGIGLSVARECIVAHGGTIETLDSRSGAHFRILLPLRPAATDEPNV